MAEPWNSIPKSGISARSIKSFRQNEFWSTQAILYDHESPLTPTTGTGNYELLMLDSEEDLIIEEPSGSCDQNRPKVSLGNILLKINVFLCYANSTSCSRKTRTKQSRKSLTAVFALIPVFHYS